MPPSTATLGDQSGIAADRGRAGHPQRRADSNRWSIAVAPVAPEDRRSHEAMMTMVDACFGSRGLGRVDDSVSWPHLIAAGVYTSDAVPDLLHGPIWTSVCLQPPAGWTEELELEMRCGILHRRLHHDATGGDVEIRRFMSAADEGVGVQIVTGPLDSIVTTEPLVRPRLEACMRVSSMFVEGTEVMMVSDRSSGNSVVVAAHDEVVDTQSRRTVTRVAGIGADLGHVAVTPARKRLAAARRLGVDVLEKRHRDAWARRWATCGTDLDSLPDLEQAVRFATYHLLCVGSSASHVAAVEALPGDQRESEGSAVLDEIAIGARGLTGSSYRGHVFWDTEVFVVPALSAIAPEGARRALNYRWNRLAAATDRAASEGCRGARFPWESAEEGTDVTPASGTTLQGETVEILTGRLEEHITADVGWAVWNHVNWTGDDGYLAGHGLDVLVGAARYWADRVTLDDDGSAHIRHVIGPDEYHEDVDDNVFTNMMVRHALDVAARTARRFDRCDEGERRSWQELGEALVDGYDAATGLYEQFAGYHALTPIVAASVAKPPMSADVLLGRNVIQSTQVIKQPDVMMAYHLVPHVMKPEVFETNLDYYMARTAHGSSLSPAIGASLLLRAERWPQAMELLDLAARLDLSDLTGTTAGGLHLATMGGVWQAVTVGMLGIRADEAGLTCDPRLPPDVDRITHGLMFRGDRIEVTAEHDRATINGAVAFRLDVNGDVQTACRHSLSRRASGWEFQ
jgi:trehalose/maltose hydrolase-like predicted phosphorylase